MALAMARPWKHPKTGIYWLRKRVPDDLRPIIGKQEEKRSLGTRDSTEAKRLHAQALLELEHRWTNLRAPPKPISEREAHELVAPAYEWWINLHRDNPSEQNVWRTEFFDGLWKRRDHAKYNHLPLHGQMRHWEEDGYLAMNAMEEFCRERVQELLTNKGFQADCLSRERIEKAFGAAIQRASLDLAKLAKGEFTGLSRQSPISHAHYRSNPIAATEPIKFETLFVGWAAERRPMQKTIYEYKRALANLATFLGHDDANRLTSQDLVAWKAKMIDAGLHPKTTVSLFRRYAKGGDDAALKDWAGKTLPDLERHLEMAQNLEK